MFIVDDIITAPGKAMLFLFRELAKKAKDDFLDDDAVKQQLQEIYALLDAGSISGPEFESREVQLLQRLEQIARIKTGDALELPPAPDVAADEGLADQASLDRVLRWRDEQHAGSPAIDGAVSVTPLLPVTPNAADPLPPPVAAAPAFQAQLPANAPPFVAPLSPSAPPFVPMLPIAPAPVPATAHQSPVPLDRQTVPVVGTMSMSQVIDTVFRSLAMLKLKVSSVTSVCRDEAGWRVTAEVLERRAVPDSGDLLGVYELRLDEAGNILRYDRTRMRRRSDLGR